MAIESEERKEAVALLNLPPSTQHKDADIKQSGILRQILISAVVITGGISSGLILGFSSVALPQLTNEDDSNQIFLTPDQASWFASLTTITAPIGCLLCGPLSDRFGRKTTLLLLNIPGLLGWLLLATATASTPNVIAQMYCGRVLTGLTVGMASIPATIYLAEIASNTQLRSMLMTWTSISITLGILVVYVLGAIFREDWQIVAVICGGLPILSVILTCLFVPESPLWLIAKGRPEHALKSLKRLRGVKEDEQLPANVQSEYDALFEAHERKDTLLRKGTEENSLRLQNDSKNFLKSFYVSTCGTLRALRRPEALKPLFIMNGLFIFQQLSGYIVITYYSVDLLLKAGVSVDPFLATIGLGLVQSVSGVIVSFILTRCGRRPMNITGGAGMALCMIALGLNMQYGWFNGWFPLLALTSIVVFSMVGFRTVPWTILGEIYPLEIKGVAVGITTCTIYIFSFITVKLYPFLVDILKSTEAIFYFYGVSSLVGTIFVIVFQPETHNKTLDQIQVELNTKRKSKGNAV